MTEVPVQPQSQPTPKGINWKIVLIGALIGGLVVGVGALGFYLIQGRSDDTTSTQVTTPKIATDSAKQATPSAEKDEFADWKTYENKGKNFSLKYPKSLTQKIDSGPVVLSASFESADYKRTEGENTALLSGFSIKVLVINSASSFTLEDSLESATDQVKLLSKESTKLDGSEAYLFEGIELPFNTTNAKTTEVLTVRKNKEYVIRLVTVEKSESEGVKIFDQMVSTFKFLD